VKPQEKQQHVAAAIPSAAPPTKELVELVTEQAEAITYDPELLPQLEALEEQLQADPSFQEVFQEMTANSSLNQHLKLAQEQMEATIVPGEREKMKRTWQAIPAFLLLLNPSASFSVGLPSRSLESSADRCACPGMKDWSKRSTLAEKSGGASQLGAAAVGLTGRIPVVFTQGNDTAQTMATVGQPLSSVAAQAGQFIKYKCRKGECGTCAVRIEGKWVRTCVSNVPSIPEGQTYNIVVRPSMVKGKKATRFFSFRSFIDGFKNNLLGMAGFVKEGPLSRKGQENFKVRLSTEEEILEKVKQRKAEKKAAAEAAGLTLEEYNSRLLLNKSMAR
jgi:hypothetical protein